jgi:hypothetical protein
LQFSTSEHLTPLEIWKKNAADNISRNKKVRLELKVSMYFDNVDLSKSDLI